MPLTFPTNFDWALRTNVLDVKRKTLILAFLMRLFPSNAISNFFTLVSLATSELEVSVCCKPSLDLAFRLNS